MSDARWLQVKALVQATLERPASERAAFLAAAVGADETLRREVESLLASDGAAVRLTDRPPDRNASPLADGLPPGDPTGSQTTFSTDEHVGPYRIVALLGTGGMGEVFRARDSRLHRDVALKMLPRAFAFDPDRLARFRREAHVLAALNHPHIAAIYGLE
jgi:eukaryotic-like serine/threonine-protein kinase